MTLKRSIPYFNEMRVYKFVRNEVLHLILGLVNQKLKIQDCRRGHFGFMQLNGIPIFFVAPIPLLYSTLLESRQFPIHHMHLKLI